MDEISPNGQGLTALPPLNMLQQMDKLAEAAASASSATAAPATPLLPLASLGHNSAAYLHRLIECMRLAFADTRYHVCDPDHADSLGEDGGQKAREVLQALLSEEYAAERVKRVDPDRTELNHPYGSPVAYSSTVSFVVVDAAGNACSFINSNYQGFGTGIVVPGWGFTLQNRGANFTLDSPANPKGDLDARGFHPNRLAGGKRPYHTIIPGLATKDGQLWAPFSVMGAFNQPQGHAQVLLNMLEFGMDPQQALDMPRFCIESGEAGGKVSLEEGISEEAVEELARRGHSLQMVRGYERVAFGRGQIIRRMSNGVLWAGSDGRGDGCAVGF